MRALIAAPLLGLALLGGCAQPQYLLSERTDAAPAATTSDLREVPARYTHHAASPATTEVVPVHIAAGFTTLEQARILAAVHEWNHVLNGAVRFDVLPTIGGPAVPGAVTILMAEGNVLPEKWRSPQPLAFAIPLNSAGGLIVIYANRLNDPLLRQTGGHDLRGIVVTELGVVLGGGNGPTMYTSRIQDCIDKNMAMSVGVIRDLPAAQLNWCETGVTVASVAR